VAVAPAGLYANLHLDPDIAMTASHHSVFLQAGCPSCHPTTSIKALKWVLLLMYKKLRCCRYIVQCSGAKGQGLRGIGSPNA